MNVIDHIKEEHDSFRGKLTKISSTTGKNKKELFRELYAEVHGHHEAEEKYIFPMVKAKKDEVSEVVLEMIEEHRLGSHQFSVLEKASVEDESWNAKFSVLKEVLDHHMQEEETEFLPLARKMIEKENSEDILDKFEALHEEKMQEQKRKLG